ncbi:hypothetical protein HY085_00315 [Candidatus Gottesmanbacteria bacterium]|nr:hypothetical protein [Candidatus Gottesmanbacteria bacterium]
MITIIHGENILASRKELEKIKNEFKGEILELDGATLTENIFIQATQSQPIFESSRLVVIDGMPKIDLKDEGFDVLIWVGKKITPPKNAKVLEFKTPPSIFKFLNNMTVTNFRAALKDNDIQFIFIMMTRQLKKDREKLLELDYQNKQGLLATDFPTAIELFLLGI